MKRVLPFCLVATMMTGPVWSAVYDQEQLTLHVYQPPTVNLSLSQHDVPESGAGLSPEVTLTVNSNIPVTIATNHDIVENRDLEIPNDWRRPTISGVCSARDNEGDIPLESTRFQNVSIPHMLDGEMTNLFSLEGREENLPCSFVVDTTQLGYYAQRRQTVNVYFYAIPWEWNGI